MRVLVTGGTGTLGREIVPRLRAAGHIVRVMSRHPGHDAGVEWAPADLATGAGLGKAVEGVEVIAHLASRPYRGRYTYRVDVEGTGRLASAARDAGVRHLVYSSIVGVDRIPWPYFRRKLAAEHCVQGGDVPWSILRATQFHTLVDAALTAVGRLPVLLGPADMPGQPVDPRDVAERLVTMLEDGPSHTVTDFGGPETLTFAELADQWLDTRRLRRRIVQVPVPGRVGRAFRDGLGLASQPPYGRITWREWLARTYRSRRSADEGR
jgi:uncharacterized protein YbjT (DUF2867 family)